MSSVIPSYNHEQEHQLGANAPPLFLSLQDQSMNQEHHQLPRLSSDDDRRHNPDILRYPSPPSNNSQRGWDPSTFDDVNRSLPPVTLPPIMSTSQSRPSDWDDPSRVSQAPFVEWGAAAYQPQASFNHRPQSYAQSPSGSYANASDPSYSPYGHPENSYAITNTHDTRSSYAHHPQNQPSYAIGPSPNQSTSPLTYAPQSQPHPAFLSAQPPPANAQVSGPHSPYQSAPNPSSVVADPHISRQLPPLTALGVGVGGRPASPSNGPLTSDSNSNVDWGNPNARPSSGRPTNGRAHRNSNAADGDRSSNEPPGTAASSASGSSISNPANANAPGSSSVASSYFINTNSSPSNGLGDPVTPTPANITPASPSSTTPNGSATNGAAPAPVKPKRRRADANQLRTLNATYDRTAFPSTEERADLAKKLGMSPRQVQIWFQNKRQSFRQTRSNSTSSQSTAHGHPHGGHTVHSSTSSTSSSTGNLPAGTGVMSSGGMNSVGGTQPGTFGSIQLSPSSAPPAPQTVAAPNSGNQNGGNYSQYSGPPPTGGTLMYTPQRPQSLPSGHLQMPGQGQHQLSHEPTVIRIDTAPPSSVQGRPSTGSSAGGGASGGIDEGDIDYVTSPGGTTRNRKVPRYR